MHHADGDASQHTRICFDITGGYGTLEEVLEMITWQQLGYHTKPVGVLNCCGFYDKLLEHFDHCVDEVMPQGSALGHFHV